MHGSHREFVAVREQLLGVSSSFYCGFWKSNSGWQAWVTSAFVHWAILPVLHYVLPVSIYSLLGDKDKFTDRMSTVYNVPPGRHAPSCNGQRLVRWLSWYSTYLVDTRGPEFWSLEPKYKVVHACNSTISRWWETEGALEACRPANLPMYQSSRPMRDPVQTKCGGCLRTNTHRCLLTHKCTLCTHMLTHTCRKEQVSACAQTLKGVTRGRWVC